MDNFLVPLFISAIPIVLIAGVIAAVSVGRTATDEHASDPGIGTVRRLFIYGLALLALIFLASGLSMLISGALDAAFGDVVIRERSGALAAALAFTVVGGPAWLLLAFASQRAVSTHPVEHESRTRRLYLALTRGIALTFVVVNAVEVGRFLVGVSEFEGSPWGWLIVWAGVWVLHERLAAADPPSTVMTRLMDRFAAYYGAALGFLVLVAGAATTIQAPLAAAYDAAYRSSLVDRLWSDDLREALIVLVVGGAAWTWYWQRRLQAGDRLTTLWQTYVFLVGVLTGVGMTVVPAARVLHATLQWAWGDPEAATAAEHFSLLPVSAAVFVVGAAAWGYHRAVLGEATASAAPGATVPRGPERVYRYLVTAVGLATLSLGLVTLFSVAADALAEPAVDVVYSAGWWRNRIVIGVTLLVVGTPLWGRFWLASQREAMAPGAAGADERASQARRVFIFGVTGVALIALLISLTIVLYQLFDAFLDGTLSRSVLRDAREAIATALTAGAAAVYYWLVLREDQAAREALPPAAAPARRREVVLLAPAGAEAVARALDEIEGVRVRTWRRLDADAAAPALRDADLAALRDAIVGMDADRVAVVVGRTGYEVVPYTE